VQSTGPIDDQGGGQGGGGGSKGRGDEKLVSRKRKRMRTHARPIIKVIPPRVSEKEGETGPVPNLWKGGEENKEPPFF